MKPYHLGSRLSWEAVDETAVWSTPCGPRYAHETPEHVAALAEQIAQIHVLMLDDPDLETVLIHRPIMGEHIDSRACWCCPKVMRLGDIAGAKAVAADLDARFRPN